MIDRYWKLKIYKDGVCKSSFECKNNDVLLNIAEDAKRKGLDTKLERCSRIEDFITNLHRFIEKYRLKIREKDRCPQVGRYDKRRGKRKL